MMARDNTGAVTAETAVVLPLLALVTVMLAWLVTLGVAQVRAVDAARQAARSLARGDGSPYALVLGKLVAPHGARFQVERHDGLVEVTATVPVDGPAGVLDFLPTKEMSATAVAAEERP